MYKGGTTTNLREHLISKHSDIYRYKKGESSHSAQPFAIPKKQASIKSFSKYWICSEERQREITDKVGNMIVLNLRPVRTADSKGFVSLMNYLELAYKVPSPTHISKILRKKHEDGVAVLKKRMANELGKCSLTTDIWTSCATEAYITVTLHGVFKDWSIQSFVLATHSYRDTVEPALTVT